MQGDRARCLGPQAVLCWSSGAACTMTVRSCFKPGTLHCTVLHCTGMHAACLPAPAPTKARLRL